MRGQPCLPGMEAFFRPEWKPRAAPLAKLRCYLQGYAAHGKLVWAQRKYIAKKVGMAVRTLARYLAWLKQEGVIAKVRRTARTSIREVVVTPKHTEPNWPISGPSIKVTPEVSQNLPKQNTTNAPSSGGEPDRGCAAQLPVGYGEQFQEYVGIFDLAFKPRNDHDLKRAHAAWIGIGPKEWPAAITDARKACREARAPRFVPSMVNHLLDQPWTRVVVSVPQGDTCDNGWAWNDPRWLELGK